MSIQASGWGFGPHLSILPTRCFVLFSLQRWVIEADIYMYGAETIENGMELLPGYFKKPVSKHACSLVIFFMPNLILFCSMESKKLRIPVLFFEIKQLFILILNGTFRTFLKADLSNLREMHFS